MIKVIKILCLCFALLLITSCANNPNFYSDYSEVVDSSSNIYNNKGEHHHPNEFETPKIYSYNRADFQKHFIDWCKTAISDEKVYEKYPDNVSFIECIRENKRILLPLVKSQNFSFRDAEVLRGTSAMYDVSYHDSSAKEDIIIRITAINDNNKLSDIERITQRAKIDMIYDCKVREQKLFGEKYYVAESKIGLKYYSIKNDFMVCLTLCGYDDNGVYKYIEIQDDEITINFEMVDLHN